MIGHQDAKVKPVYKIIERIYFISPYVTTSHFTTKVLYTMASDENDKTNV